MGSQDRAAGPHTRQSTVSPPAASVPVIRPMRADNTRVLVAPPGSRSGIATTATPVRVSGRRALVMLLVSLLVVAVSAVLATGNSSAQPHRAVAAAAQQPSIDPCPPNRPSCGGSTTPTRPTVVPTMLPLPTMLPTCQPGGPLPPVACELPPTTTRPPCTGPDCIPDPTATLAPPTGPAPPGQGGPGGGTSDDCGITDIGACISEAIDGFFRGIVTTALNPLLDLLGHTLLSTPTPSSLPRIGELWAQSWEILLASYILFVLIGGVIVMSYQTVQTRYSIKEIAPRLVMGFLAGALSLFVITKAVDLANALAVAILGAGVDPGSSASTLKTLVLNSLNGGLWIIFLGLAVAGMLIILLISYVVRVCVTLLLIAAAPLALMMHALPQTDGIARAWWKGIFGCLAIQVAQSLTLVTALRVFLAPGGFTVFGPTTSGLINLLVCLALFYVLIKIPFWCLSPLRHGNGRSLLGSVAYAYVMGKALGVLGHRRRGYGPSRAARPSASRQSGGSSQPGKAPPARQRLVDRDSVEALGQRLERHQARERRRGGRRQAPPPVPRFQQAAPQTPTHDRAIWQPHPDDTLLGFRSAVPENPATRRPAPKPSEKATPARFSAAPAPHNARRPPGVPAQLQFRTAQPRPTSPQPFRTSGSPNPVEFRTAPPDPGRHRQARTHTPAPVQFSSSTPSPPRRKTPPATETVQPPQSVPTPPSNTPPAAASSTAPHSDAARQPPRSSAPSRSATSTARPRPVVAPVFQPPTAPAEPTPQPLPPSPAQRTTPTTGTPTDASAPSSTRARKPARRKQPTYQPPGGENR